MRDSPNVDALLAASRDSLVLKILPVVADEYRLELLMIANALAIARRTLAAGDAAMQTELAALQSIYSLPAAPHLCGVTLEREVAALNARLAHDIRNGAFDHDGPPRRAVRALLDECVKQKLRETRPKLLTAAGLI